ncbi:DNA-processing protein DprA [Rosistilla oblonga]|nr:DNA-processing protein DprA [Rosistilla oblonga]
MSEISGNVDDPLIPLLRLAMLPGIGPRTLTALLECFDSPSDVLAASADALMRVAGVGPKLVDAIRSPNAQVDVEDLIAECQRLEIEIVPQAADGYPKRLLELCDAPPVLFMRGTFVKEDELAVAIVGTRHPTPYGRRQTQLLSAGLARAGVTVVSGLARGIDGIAHQAALDAGGRTIAVLGGGMGAIYPAEHGGLADDVTANGCLISENPPWAKPRAGMFPQRNRLISGLSLGVCVIEAADRSGALITARLASEQGRDCFALPGPVNSRMSRGTNQLIRDGVTLIQSVDDILESLGPLSQPVQVRDADDAPRQLHQAAELLLNEQECQVLDAIGAMATSIDEIIANTKLPAHRVLSTVSVLEMRRLVRRTGGQHLVRI